MYTNAEKLLIATLATNFSEMWSEINTFSLQIMHFKMSCAKWRTLCLGVNVLIVWSARVIGSRWFGQIEILIFNAFYLKSVLWPLCYTMPVMFHECVCCNNLMIYCIFCKRPNSCFRHLCVYLKWMVNQLEISMDNNESISSTKKRIHCRLKGWNEIVSTNE